MNKMLTASPHVYHASLQPQNFIAQCVNIKKLKDKTSCTVRANYKQIGAIWTMLLQLESPHHNQYNCLNVCEHICTCVHIPTHVYAQVYVGYLCACCVCQYVCDWMSARKCILVCVARCLYMCVLMCVFSHVLCVRSCVSAHAHVSVCMCARMRDVCGLNGINNVISYSWAQLPSGDLFNHLLSTLE